jgi:hypothetical protein
MSRRRGVPRRSSLRLSVVLNWFEKAYKRCLGSVVSSAIEDHRRDPSEVALPTNIGQGIEVDFCGKRIELRKLTRLLSVGDRIRILCDDGVLVAEKVSPTQFKLIQSQTAGELVH